MANSPKETLRSISESSFMRKLKLSKFRSKSSSQVESKSRQSRRKLKNNASVDALIRPSLSLRRSGKGKHEIAKRRISLEIRRTDSDFSLASHSKRASAYELPDIVSIKSAKTRRTHSNTGSIGSDEERDLHFSFAPRRSLQNSTAGMKKINTGHGFFNIPVTVDVHNDRTSENVLQLNNTPNYLKKNETQDISTQSNNPDTTITANGGGNSSSNGLFSTILSLAHTAVNHVPRISIEEPHDNEQSKNDNTLNQSHSNLGTIPNNNSHNKINNNDTQNDSNANDTVIYNPANINRSTSFLKHLDYLLSASNQNCKNAGVETPISPGNDNGVLLSITGNKFGIEPSSTTSKVSNDTSNDEPLDQSPDEKINRVKFEPLKSTQPAIKSLGKGDLTLDAFSSSLSGDDNNILNDKIYNINSNNQGLKSANLDLNNLENINPIVSNNDTTIPALKKNMIDPNLLANYRNSSYVNLTQPDSSEEMTKNSRIRSKTMPTNEIPLPNGITKKNEDKATKRYSSVSNDEVTDMDGNPRKSRAMSRNFLSRRSFSPNINMKVLPGISLRNSMARNRNSSDLVEPPTLRVRTSTNLSGMLSSVMDIEYGNSQELEGIEYTTEKRNTEFHTLFKDADLNPNERLIIDHSCALSRDILLQGRMYISDQHICFYSNILGWVSSVIIPFNEIVQIEKKTTAGIFPNGIVIDTLHTKYVFASFISRDSTFDLITDVWNQIILGRRHIKDNDDFDSELLSTYSTTGDASQGSDFYDDENDSDLNDTDMTSSDDLEDGVFADISNAKNAKLPANSKLGPMKHAPTTANYVPAPNERLLNETTIPGPLGKVAAVICGDDVSILEQILKAQKNYDISPIPKLLETKTRDYSYTKPLNAGFGPSKTKCLISDKVIHYDLNDYVQVMQSSKTPDVPSGNAFTVKNNTILTWDSDNTTKVTVYFSTEWTAKSWLKGAIEKGAYDGVSETTRVMNQEITKFIKEDNFGNGFSKKDAGKESDNEIDVSTLPTTGPATHAPTEPEYQKEKTDVVVEPCINIPAPLGTVFEVIYGDDPTYFFSILEKQNTFNISDIPKFVNNEREFNYIKRLGNSLGPKQTKCLITEEIEHKDLNDYIMVKQTVRSPDVPYGNSFSVQTRIFLSWGPSNTTNMMTVTNVIWTGKSILKGTIEKGSIDGQRSGTKTLVEELKEIIANADSKKKKTRKRSKTSRQQPSTSTNIRRRLPQIMEQEAPAESIFSNIISFIGDFDLTSISGIITVIISIIFLIGLISYWIRSGNRHTMVLVKPGRILIDGNEYNYVPNIKTLYEVYEDDITNAKKNSYKGIQLEDNIITRSEDSIWDWLEDRGEGLGKPSENLNSININDYNGNNLNQNGSKKNSKNVPNAQKLMESIKITEIQLKHMKDMLANSDI